MMPERLTRPSVGLIPTREFADEGQTTEPSVSVPIAAASNFSAAAIGTETDGSIVCPSSANSLVGIKPTLGLVSRAGIIPIAHSQDTAGPMARTVADAAIILTALTGEDTRDPMTKEGRGKAVDYTKFLDRDGLRGMRLGIARKHFG